MSLLEKSVTSLPLVPSLDDDEVGLVVGGGQTYRFIFSQVKAWAIDWMTPLFGADVSQTAIDARDAAEAAVATVSGFIRNASSNYAVRWLDGDGNVSAYFTKSFDFWAPTVTAPVINGTEVNTDNAIATKATFPNGSMTTSEAAGQTLRILDPDRFIIFQVTDEGVPSGAAAAGSGASFSAAERATVNTQGIAYSGWVNSTRVNTDVIQLPTFGYNLFLECGQSFQLEQEAHPLISVTYVAGNKMLGNSVSPTQAADGSWDPFGGSTVVTNLGGKLRIGTRSYSNTEIISSSPNADQSAAGYPNIVMTGTVTANGTVTLTGTGTAFTTQFATNKVAAFTFGSNTYTRQIESVASNTSLTLNEAIPAGSGGTGVIFDVNIGSVFGTSGAQALMNDFRARWLAAKGVGSDSTHEFVCNSVARSGAGITEISYGGIYWSKFTNYLTGMQTAAVNDSRTLGIVALIFAQGQHDYNSMDKATYRGHLDQYIADVETRLVAGTLGQTKKPVWIMEQTSGSFTRDTYPIGVGMAQLECALDTANVFMAGPAWFPNKYGHPSVTGQVWRNLYFSKVLDLIINRSLDFKPMHVIRDAAIYRGRELLLPFHVPVGKIQVAQAYNAFSAVSMANAGLYAVDDLGPLTVSEFNIKDHSVQVIFDRSITSAAKTLDITFGRLDFAGGNTFLQDEDYRTVTQVFQSISGSTMWAEEKALAIALAAAGNIPMNNRQCSQLITASQR